MPIYQAWHKTGRVLGENTGLAISFAIGPLPWLPVIGIGLLLLRLFVRLLRR